MTNSTTNSSASSPMIYPLQQMAIKFAARGMVNIVLEAVIVVFIFIVGLLGNAAVCVAIF